MTVVVRLLVVVCGIELGVRMTMARVVVRMGVPRLARHGLSLN